MQLLLPETVVAALLRTLQPPRPLALGCPLSLLTALPLAPWRPRRCTIGHRMSQEPTAALSVSLAGRAAQSHACPPPWLLEGV